LRNNEKGKRKTIVKISILPSYEKKRGPIEKLIIISGLFGRDMSKEKEHLSV